MIFKDRADAGLQLASLLAQYKGNSDVIVLGLARGGVVVAHAIAAQLHVDLNVLVIRKLGAPSNPELALGAIAEDGVGVYNERLIAMLGVSPAYLETERERQMLLIQERLLLYRKNSPPPVLEGKIVIV
ncbi:MAG: phosphoribosyltransferase family protein, partial [Chlamydiota bacterium]